MLRGTPAPDVIVGRGGDDLLLGRGGDDLLCGGAGEDAVRGGANAQGYLVIAGAFEVALPPDLAA